MIFVLRRRTSSSAGPHTIDVLHCSCESEPFVNLDCWRFAVDDFVKIAVRMCLHHLLQTVY